MERRSVKTIVAISITVLFLGFAFYNVDFGEIWAEIQSTSIAVLLLCGALFLLSCVFRAWMWRETTRPIGAKIRFIHLFAGVMVGYMSNNILPLRIGELVRSHYLMIKSGLAGAPVLATILVERIFDVLSLVLLAVFALTLNARVFNHSYIHEVIAFSLVCLLLLFFGRRRFKAFLKNIIDRPGSFIKKFETKIKGFWLPLKNSFNRKNFPLLILISLGAWFCNYWSIYVLIRELPGHAMEATFLLLLLINAGFLLPSSPGALGVMQVAFWVALAPFEVAKENAIGLSLAYQATLYFFTLSIGLPFFASVGFRLKKVAISDELRLLTDTEKNTR